MGDTFPTMTNDKPQEVPCLLSRRWILAYVCFFGYFFMYSTRVNMSVAVLCMARTPNTTGTHGKIGSTNTTGIHGNIGLTKTTGIHGNTSPTNTTTGIHGNTNPTNTTTDIEGEYDECGQLTSSRGRGEFDWDKSTRSRILAMYFYGYIVMQIPGGWLAGRYGGRMVWGSALFVCGVCTILTPIAARTSLYLLYVIRFLIGFAAGVTFPTVHSMWGRWAPPLERSKLMTFGMAGPACGTIAAFALSGYLCAYGFDNGWGSIFYVFGIGTLVWLVFLFWLTADSPGDSSRISQTELQHIETAIGYKTNQGNQSTPWRAIFRSKAVWAIVIAHICHNWTNYTLLTGLPSFMKESLKFDIKQNGGLSALPYLCAGLVSICAGQVADTLRTRTRLSTATVRKALNAASLLTVASFLVSTTYVSCERKYLAVLFLCIAVGGTGIIRAGFAINHVDIAPRHAGVLIGISNTLATVPGMVAPLVTGAMTPNKTTEEWRNVFWVCCGFAGTGAILFALLAEGEVQEWATQAGDRPETLRYHVIPRDHIRKQDNSMEEELDALPKI